MWSKHMLALIYIHRLQALETHPGHRTRSVKSAPQVGSAYASCRGMNESAAAVMTLQQNIKIHKILSFVHFFLLKGEKRWIVFLLLKSSSISFPSVRPLTAPVTFMTMKRKEEGERSRSDGDVFVLGHTVPPSGLHCSIFLFFFMHASRPAHD